MVVSDKVDTEHIRADSMPRQTSQMMMQESSKETPKVTSEMRPSKDTLVRNPTEQSLDNSQLNVFNAESGA